MNQSSSSIFKRTGGGRQKRLLVPDGTFKKGMRYTDGFLDSQTVKLLVNQRIMDQGSYLTPRNGIKGTGFKMMTLEGTYDSASKVASPHLVYYGTYKDSDGFDKFGNIIISFGEPSDPDYRYYLTDKADLDADYYKMKFEGNAFADMTKDDGSFAIINVEGLLPARTKFYLDQPKPVYVVFEYQLYYLGYTLLGIPALLKVTVSWDDILNSYKAVATEVTPKTVSLAEATSIGFNMLSTNPYDFENVADLNLSVTGTLPYKPGTEELMLSCNQGERIKFVTYYKYKLGETYRAQYEYAVFGSTEYTVIQDYAHATYINGSECSVEFTPGDSKFILRVTMVPLLAGVAQTTLAKVAVYPLYQVGQDDLKSVGTNNYALNEATGLGAHNGMLILWGVPGVEATLFFSDVSDPSYFPFPQNTFSFPEVPLGVRTFSGALFIFTERSVYYIEGYSMFEMYEPKTMYENLTFTKEDMFCMQAVSKGLLIRPSGKYYMMTPNPYTGLISDLRVIPISTPVADLIYGWESFLKLLSQRLYKFDVSWSENTTIKQYDFFNFVEYNVIKNFYRFAIYEARPKGLMRYQIDVGLSYDSELGVWFTEVASFPFNGVVNQGSTLYTSFLQIGVMGSDLYIQKMGYYNTDCVDTYNTMYYGDAANDNPTSTREAELANFPAIGQAVVTRVVDGDTIELEGLGSIRFHYVNTPESVGDIIEPEAYGVAASNYMKELLPIGSVVTFVFDGPRADKYDRCLCWLLKDGVLVQKLLAEQGYVKSIYDFQASNMTYIDEVEAALAIAVANKVGLYANISPEGPFYVRSVQSAELLGNFQILDTGNRDQEPYIKKRYKEVQFMVSNESPAALAFYTEFYVDAMRRRTPFSYEIIHNTDPNSTDYGTIYVVEREEANMTVANETALDFLSLDVSMFPDLEIIKVVFRVNGIGHYPRVVLVSRNQASHKILGYAWVFRLMNAR